MHRDVCRRVQLREELGLVSDAHRAGQLCGDGQAGGVEQGPEERVREAPPRVRAVWRLRPRGALEQLAAEGRHRRDDLGSADLRYLPAKGLSRRAGTRARAATAVRDGGRDEPTTYGPSLLFACFPPGPG